MKKKFLLTLAINLALISSCSSIVFANVAIESPTNNTKIISEKLVDKEIKATELTSTDWLMDEVAKLLNKDVQALNENDYNLITTLDLSNKNLEGSIPETISKLKNLSSLKVNNNKLTGDIPESIGNLKALTYLDLSNNNFTKLPQNIIDKTINKSYSYINIDKTSIKLNRGIYFLKGKSYLIDENRQIGTNWQIVDNVKYLVGEDGMILTGWQLIKGSMATELKIENGSWIYIEPNGVIATGWKSTGGYWYYLNPNGTMAIGWRFVDGHWFYLKANGCMEKSGYKVINQNTYCFYDSGVMVADKWVENNKYIQSNGLTRLTTVNDAHSSSQYNLFNYMINVYNEESVHQRAIDLHGGSNSNNCVYFASEALRRVGFSIPNQTCNTKQLEIQLARNTFKYYYNLSDLKPGDIVFSGSAHVYIFMGWYDNEYAYIVDNQKGNFGTTLHKRKITSDDDVKDTYKATHFYHL